MAIGFSGRQLERADASPLPTEIVRAKKERVAGVVSTGLHKDTTEVQYNHEAVPHHHQQFECWRKQHRASLIEGTVHG